MANPNIFFPQPAPQEVSGRIMGIPLLFRLQSDRREKAIQDTDDRVILAWPKAKQIIDVREGLLTNSDLMDVSRVMFSDNNVLSNTLGQLNFDQTPISLQTSRLQNGSFAHHLIWAAEDRSQHFKYFVTYISRFPITNLLGLVAEEDYKYLQELQYNSTRAKNGKYSINVVKPLAFGLFQYKGFVYPVYTAKYNKIGAELHVSYDTFVGLPDGTNLGFPLFHYPLEDNDNMTSGNVNVVHTFDGAKDVFMKNAQNQGIAFAVSQLLKSPAAALSQKQQFEVAKACASLFLLAGNQYPTQQEINAGDWMTELRNGIPTNFTLVTTRGFMGRLNDMQWIDWMMTHMENDTRSGERYRPFPALKKSDYLSILKMLRQ